MNKRTMVAACLAALWWGLVGGCAADDQSSGGQPSPSASVTSPTVVSPTETSGRTTEYTSPKGVRILLDDLAPGATITSPVTITGQVPGSWSFEASFPVVLVDWDGKIIAQEPAQLQGDWMTEELVPFTVTLTFDTPTYKNTGSLILRKDNPSGMPKFDDALEVAVVFG